MKIGKKEDESESEVVTNNFETGHKSVNDTIILPFVQSIPTLI